MLVYFNVNDPTVTEYELIRFFPHPPVTNVMFVCSTDQKQSTNKYSKFRMFGKSPIFLFLGPVYGEHMYNMFIIICGLFLFFTVVIPIRSDKIFIFEPVSVARFCINVA